MCSLPALTKLVFSGLRWVFGYSSVEPDTNERTAYYFREVRRPT